MSMSREFERIRPSDDSRAGGEVRLRADVCLMLVAEASSRPTSSG